MHPILLEDTWIGDLNSYGTLILFGGLSLLPGLWWECRERALRAELLIDIYIVFVVGCFVGGRLLDVLSRPSVFLAEPARIFSGQDSFVFYGSLLGVFVGFLWLAHKYRRPLAELCDMVAPWIPLGHGIARIGCWLAGCCFGAPVTGDPAWAARFPAGSIAYAGGEVPCTDGATVGLFPVQLFEVVGLEAIALLLIGLRLRRGIEPPWRAAGRYALAYGILRLVTELFRGDHSRNHLFIVEFPGIADLLRLPADQPFLLSTSQLISVALIAWGAVMIRRSRRTGHALSSEPPS